jgi:hypothetical protein
VIDVTSKVELLRSLDFGDRVAEFEAANLANYFVYTDLWRETANGDVDLIVGAKGSGKSALYSMLMARSSDFAARKIALITAENATGHTVFKDLTPDPPPSESEFLALWKLYILSLLGQALVTGGVNGDAAKQVKDALVSEGLLSADNLSIGERLRIAAQSVKAAFRPSEVTQSTVIDPTTGGIAGFSTSLSFRQPTSDERARGMRSLDDLLSLANDALLEQGTAIWILFDRLDVAFADSPEVERLGLRALLKAYLDLVPMAMIKPKIFLRSDILRQLVAGGFREASHITKTFEIKWASADLLNLVVRRIVANSAITEWAGVVGSDVLQSGAQQREFFDSLVPDKVDKGKNPRTFDWILSRVQDGSKQAAPREVIHLLTEAKKAQIARLDRGETEPPNTEIFSALAFRDAIAPVSNARLDGAIYAEYPDLRPYIEGLEGEKAEQTIDTLMVAWNVTAVEAEKRARLLVEIGVFEKRGERRSPKYWVPLVYRSALKLVQGSAETRRRSLR